MAQKRKQIVYRVYFTPLIQDATYGTEVEVSDRVDISGIKRIKQSVDSGDFQVGVFTSNDITVRLINFDGKFNDETDSRSMFPAGRDLTKVRVSFTELDEEGDETATISFLGLINEEATKQDIKTDSVTFRVLSSDSVIRKSRVPSGRVASGSDTVSTAVVKILNTPKISSVLTVSAANINPDVDVTIDDGESFNDRPTLEALNDLMLASNSVLIIDQSDNVIVKSRLEDTTKDVINLYGPFDQFGRENIINITKYNPGRHRTFTTVKVNNILRTNAAFEEIFGARRKTIDLDFITSDTTEAIIAARVLDEFKMAKIELNVDVATQFVKDAELLDRVSVNYPLRVVPTSKFLPVIGVTEIGDANDKLPRTFGSISINDRTAFKIIEKVEDPRNFVTRLKLRQVGKDFDDGVFDVPGSCLVGFAIIGECTLGPAGDTCATWNPSVAGAAQVGCTKIA